MAYRQTCVSCTFFDSSQGMQAHPVYNTPEEWAQHLFESHGGPGPKPKPAPIAEDSFTREDSPALGPDFEEMPDLHDAELAALGNILDRVQERADVLAAELDQLKLENREMAAQVAENVAQIGGLVAMFESLQKRVDGLEPKP